MNDEAALQIWIDGKRIFAGSDSPSEQITHTADESWLQLEDNEFEPGRTDKLRLRARLRISVWEVTDWMMFALERAATLTFDAVQRGGFTRPVQFTAPKRQIPRLHPR